MADFGPPVLGGFALFLGSGLAPIPAWPGFGPAGLAWPGLAWTGLA